MSNPYFKNVYDPNNNESELYRKAVDELIEIHGIEFKYIMKDQINPDYIFGEDNLTFYNSHPTVTFLIENYQDFDGVDDMFSKFGFQVDNKLTLAVERSRLFSILGKAPEIGDLIFHPNSQKIFELKHINDDVDFYQMNGGNYLYKFSCEIFIPSHEDFDTNVDIVDELDTETTIDNSLERDQFGVEELLNIDFDETDVFGNL